MSLSDKIAAPSLAKPIIFIFDGMRTRSHLFFRYLSTNSGLDPIYHPFLRAAILGQERWAKGAKCCEARRKMIEEGMQPFITEETHESLQGKLIEKVERAKKEV